MLLENGGVNVDSNKRPAVKKQKSEVPPEPKVRENERKIPRRYMLTMLRDGGFYSPMTDAEFEEFRRQNPQIAKYFEVDENDEDVTPLTELAVPEVPDTAPICDQWEKAATRMLTTLQRDQKAYIFANPVDYVALGILDYLTVV